MAAIPPATHKLERFPLLSFHKEHEHPAENLSKVKTDLAPFWLEQGEKARQDRAGRPLLVVRNLDRHFVIKRSLWRARNQTFQALHNICLTIHAGEIVGLVGESGSGKSTLAKILSGLLPATLGEISYDGQILSQPTSRLWRHYRHQIQMIFQDPYSSLNPRQRVVSMIGEACLQHDSRLSRRERLLRVDDLLELVGMRHEDGRKFAHEFSGGQRQRIAIARALATRPRFLICDEPTSALDVSIQAQILNLLKDLQASLGLTMLFISHDLPVIRQMCDRVAVMYEGKLCEIAPTEVLFEAPHHSHTKELLRLMPNLAI